MTAPATGRRRCGSGRPPQWSMNWRRRTPRGSRLLRHGVLHDECLPHDVAAETARFCIGTCSCGRSTQAPPGRTWTGFIEKFSLESEFSIANFLQHSERWCEAQALMPGSAAALPGNCLVEIRLRCGSLHLLEHRLASRVVGKAEHSALKRTESVESSYVTNWSYRQAASRPSSNCMRTCIRPRRYGEPHQGAATGLVCRPLPAVPPCANQLRPYWSTLAYVGRCTRSRSRSQAPGSPDPATALRLVMPTGRLPRYPCRPACSGSRSDYLPDADLFHR